MRIPAITLYAVNMCYSHSEEGGPRALLLWISVVLVSVHRWPQGVTQWRELPVLQFECG